MRTAREPAIVGGADGCACLMLGARDEAGRAGYCGGSPGRVSPWKSPLRGSGCTFGGNLTISTTG